MPRAAGALPRAAACCAVLAPLVACGPPPVEADLQTGYTSLEELAANSVDVVTVRTEGSRIEGSPAHGFVMSEAVVLGSMEQQVGPGERIEIRQSATVYSNTASALSVGEVYVVFLVRVDPDGSEELAAYDITGQVGAWVVEDGSGELMTAKSDLPEEIEVSVDSGVLEVSG